MRTLACPQDTPLGNEPVKQQDDQGDDKKDDKTDDAIAPLRQPNCFVVQRLEPEQIRVRCHDPVKAEQQQEEDPDYPERTIPPEWVATWAGRTIRRIIAAPFCTLGKFFKGTPEDFRYVIIFTHEVLQ